MRRRWKIGIVRRNNRKMRGMNIVLIENNDDDDDDEDNDKI